MSGLELFILAVGLSMDAFAVSVCKGLAMKKVTLRKACRFGGFQALMPAIGCFLGTSFASYITRYDHWVAFVLLALIGANMIREALSRDEERADDNLSVKAMLVLAVATSIVALAVGITFAFLEVNLLWAVLFIGAITFTLSAVGVKVGNVFGEKYKSRAELVGGAILVLLGVKILLEHLNLLPF